jgi:hypothetical protein
MPEALGQLATRLFPEFFYGVRGMGNGIVLALQHPGFLTVDPGALRLDEELSVPARAPSGYRHPDGAIGTNTDHVTAGTWMADEFHGRINIVVGTDSE